MSEKHLQLNVSSESWKDLAGIFQFQKEHFFYYIAKLRTTTKRVINIIVT